MDPNNEDEIMEYSCIAELLTDMKRDQIRYFLINEEKEETASKLPLPIKEFKQVPIVMFNKQTQNWFQTKDQIGFSSNGQIPVHMASYIPQDSQKLSLFQDDVYNFSIKFFCRASEAFKNLKSEAQRNRIIPNHDNVLGIETAFHYREYLCLLFPLMDRGSIRSLMIAKYPEGYPEDCAVVALHETLKGLSFIHGNGLVHGDISAGHVFMNYKGDMKLAYFGTIYEALEDLDEPSSSLPMISISDWAVAPEVYKLREKDYTQKADIWLIGILALELLYGTKFKFENRGALDLMVKKINETKRLPKKGKDHETSTSQEVKTKEYKLLSSIKGLLKGVLSGFKERVFSKELEKMVVRCLATDPEERPTADELLKSEIFWKSKGVAYFHNLVK